MMVRKVTLSFLTVLAMLAGIIILPQTAAAVSLKHNSIVNGDTITLGDVFEGLPENQEKVLGLAPQPGQDMTLNARTLLRIAIALDLPWRPQSTADQITLTRAASIVDRGMIESALRAGLEKQGVGGKYQLTLPETATRIVLAPDIAPGVEIGDITVKPDTGWFEAVAYAPSAANPVHKTKINGTIQKLVDVPVLRGSIQAGDIIGERDIDFVELKEAELRPDMIVNVNDIVGMTPRRLTTPGKPLKTIDLESPQLIARGETVTMMFQQGGMVLTASGKALENGAKGDLIRVLNNSSNKTIEGIVTASKEVTIQSF